MSQRYFLEELNQIITGQDAHHIKKVMRMKTGDEIIVCAQKKCFLASIEINESTILNFLLGLFLIFSGR